MAKKRKPKKPRNPAIIIAISRKAGRHKKKEDISWKKDMNSQ